ncbi:hypothetical protein ON010_g17976 [Phytophthora cinnamomi]|nr:hypothetical protein ON010_g17976 [Phytophthora cinnamomi]
MAGWLDDEKLEPMPPPPAPQAHPNPRLPSRTHTTLVALSDESARNVKLQRECGGMAIRSTEQILRRHPVVTGKRLDPTFLSRARIKAFTERESPEPEEEIDNPLAVETEHYSRTIALQLQRQLEEMEKAPPLEPLGEQERTLAATEASARRRELLQAARRAASESRWNDGDGENDAGLLNGEGDSALKRATERKVRKQLNAKWVQSRQDPANRPKGPLDRPEERDLRETLFRTTARDLLRSGVLMAKNVANSRMYSFFSLVINAALNARIASTRNEWATCNEDDHATNSASITAASIAASTPTVYSALPARSPTLKIITATSSSKSVTSTNCTPTKLIRNIMTAKVTNAVVNAPSSLSCQTRAGRRPLQPHGAELRGRHMSSHPHLRRSCSSTRSSSTTPARGAHSSTPQPALCAIISQQASSACHITFDAPNQSSLSPAAILA